jgi:hypothetical protein
MVMAMMMLIAIPALAPGDRSFLDDCVLAEANEDRLEASAPPGVYRRWAC